MTISTTTAKTDTKVYKVVVIVGLSVYGFDCSFSTDTHGGIHHYQLDEAIRTAKATTGINRAPDIIINNIVNQVILTF